MYESFNHKKIDVYLSILAWARLNFELQSVLSKPELVISTETKDKLCKVGYMAQTDTSLCPQEVQSLFKEGEFFSSIKTGNRIIAFALKENGLNKEAFKHIEENITIAYQEVRQLNGENQLLDMSYAYTLEALDVFRP